MRSRRELFQVRFWGVRGSYPTSGRETLKYGGHTSCVDVQAGAHRLIFDAGTGIINLGEKLTKHTKAPLVLNIFLSHTHHDHIFGFYFFAPLTRSNTRLFIFGPDAGRKSLQATLEAALDSHFFPIGLSDFDARKALYSLNGEETVLLTEGRPKVYSAESFNQTRDAVTIVTHKSRAHPKNGVLLYRVAYLNRSMVYATDIEEKEGGWPDIIEFARGADLLIHDAQYLNKEYFSRSDPRKGWGHSTIERCIEAARKAKVKRLVLFHHDPKHNDEMLGRIETQARRLFPSATAAYEGMKVDLLKL